MKNILDKIFIKEIIGPIIIIISFFIIYKILVRIIKKIFTIKSKRINAKKQHTFMNFFINVLKTILFIISILMILQIYGIDTKVIIASLGALTVVFGLALQDLLKDIIAGISLVFEGTYDVGDWVTVNGFKGEVISVGIKTTRIKAFGGEILVVNNGSITQIINHTIANSTALVDVNVAYESDIENVETVLNKLCKKLNKKLPSLKSDIMVLGIEELGDSAITFRIMVEVVPGEQYAIQREIRKAVKIELDNNNIVIPYNQLVIHHE